MSRHSQINRLLGTLLNGLDRPLGPDPRRHLLALFTDPTPETWQDAYRIVVNGTVTVWQAMIRADATCPTELHEGDTPRERWKGYRPDPFTLLLALSAYAHDPTVLEVDYGTYVIAWRRGEPVARVWRGGLYDPLSATPAAYTVTMPADAPFEQSVLDKVADALFAEPAGDLAAYRRRADVVADTVAAGPVDASRHAPGLALAGVTVHLWPDPDRPGLVLDIDTRHVPDWLRDEDVPALRVVVDGDVTHPAPH